MEKEKKQHIVRYRTYALILLVLLVFTSLSVLVTSYDLGPLAVTAALFFATAKATLVFLYFMHLKFDDPVIRIMVVAVLSIFIIVMVITFLDYSFR